MDGNYTDTSGTLARAAGVTIPTINLYSELRLLDFIVASNGIKLFKPGQGERVRQIKAQRMAAKPGRPRRVA
jgi:DNA-binding transcriptional MerR regulator